MRRAAPLAALLLFGCAGSKLKPGLRDGGLVLEGDERAAVERTLGLFVSSATAAARADSIEKDVLAKAPSFIAKRSAKNGRALVLVALPKLAAELERLGLVKPEGVSGSPRVLVSLREAGPGAGRDVGRASEALRRELLARGYSVVDLSDRLDKLRQKTGDVEEAKRVGRETGASVVIAGEAAAAASTDERLEGFQTFRARVVAEAWGGRTGEPLAIVEVGAGAVDASAEAAAAKALENAGASAGIKLAAELAGRFRQREEVTVVVFGLGPWENALKFVEAVRTVEGVAAAAAARLTPGEARLRVWVEKLSADDLTARLLQLKSFALQPRWVEPDARHVELEVGRLPSDSGSGTSSPYGSVGGGF